MPFRLPPNDKRSKWIKLAVIAVLVRLLFGFFPGLCESIYSRGIFPWIRYLFDNSIGRLSIAPIYLFLMLFVGWLVYKSIHFISFLRQSRGRRLKEILFSGTAFLGALIFWFLLLWGYNYARIPLAEQLRLQPPESMDFDAVWAEAQYIKKTCINLRNEIPKSDTNALTDEFYPDNLEDKMRTTLEQVLQEYGYDTEGHVRGRFIEPSGLLLRFNSSGVYFPFTGEGHVDKGLHIITKPFTMAHELAHGYGFGSEAACNFWGFLACINSEHPAIRYSGYLAYWRYVYGSLMEFMTEEEYLSERATISRAMHNDVEAIYMQQDKYLPFIPFLQPALYDVFLKIQGVKDGIKSYNRMVLLVAAWRKIYTN